MKVRIPAVCLIALVTAAAPAPAPASNRCTCMSPKRPACEVWWQTSVIFVGRVTRIRTVTDEAEDGAERTSRIVTMRVGERLRGLERRDRDVEVRTGAGGSDCGFDFRAGETYLVYAGESALTGRLETGICSRTALAEEATADLAYLRELEDAPKLISLYGMVYRERQTLPPGKEPKTPLDPGGPIPGTPITLENHGVVRTTQSDAEGWYEFADLSPGQFEVTLQDELVGGTGRWRFTLTLAPACVWRNIIVDPLPIKDERPGAPAPPLR